jgi:hypothetical protein
MKQETERNLQHLSNMHTVLEMAKHGLYSLQPQLMSREVLGVYADMLHGLNLLQIDIQSAAFDMKNGRTQGEG